jgi:hypothetical protein
LIRRSEKYDFCSLAKLILRHIYTKVSRIQKFIAFTAACPKTKRAVLALLELVGLRKCGLV